MRKEDTSASLPPLLSCFVLSVLFIIIIIYIFFFLLWSWSFLWTALHMDDEEGCVHIILFVKLS